MVDEVPKFPSLADLRKKESLSRKVERELARMRMEDEEELEQSERSDDSQCDSGSESEDKQGAVARKQRHQR